MTQPRPAHEAQASEHSGAHSDLQYQAAQEALRDLLRQSYTELPLRNAEKLDSVLTALLQACGITATLFAAGLAATAIPSAYLADKPGYVAGRALVRPGRGGLGRCDYGGP